MLKDRPVNGIRWNCEIEPEMLTAIGELAVASAHMEELLHQIYWKHAGLDERSGPIVTEILNPKRLAEDIKKLVALDPAKTHILDDLKLLFKEFEDINTKRNCLHWIWSVIEDADNSTIVEAAASSYKVSRPRYKQSGIESQHFDVEGVREIALNCNWLNRRFYSHSLSEDALQNFRDLVKGHRLEYLVDIVWPAPWLDKSPSPNSTPKDHPGTSK